MKHFALGSEMSEPLLFHVQERSILNPSLWAEPPLESESFRNVSSLGQLMTAMVSWNIFLCCIRACSVWNPTDSLISCGWNVFMEILESQICPLHFLLFHRLSGATIVLLWFRELILRTKHRYNAFHMYYTSCKQQVVMICVDRYKTHERDQRVHLNNKYHTYLST